MRDVSALPRESFDFVWSSCAFEHLGTLETGLAFVIRSTELLKVGGVAAHTTEYNVSSNDGTLATGDPVVYRRRDLEDLDRRLRRIGCGMARFDFDPGVHRYDLEYVYPPFDQRDPRALKLLLGDHVATSILIVIHKGARAPY